MKHIKMFNEHKLGETGFEYLTDEEFESRKEEMLNQIKLLYKNYDNFSKMVAPGNWRMTGHHMTELRKMMEDFKFLYKIHKSDLENEWVRKSVLGERTMGRNNEPD